MSLPIRTTLEDIDAVCAYLATKPMGSNLNEMRTVLDSKHLDGRKLSALKKWGLIIDTDDALKVTDLGRAVVRSGGTAGALTHVIRNIDPYRAIIERARHRNEESLTSVDVGAHWHEHFPDEVSSKEKILSDQAVCFFRIADAAELGSLVMGRKGSITRFDFDIAAVSRFIVDDDIGIFPPGVDEDFPAKDEPDEVFDAPKPAKPDIELGQAIFIAHGKNKKPLEQLKKILDQFKVPYKTAVDEPNLGRPIGTKVREVMHSCNCAILIFTADEEFQDKEGNPVWRPSENVVYELGAAGYLYDSRIVILKEDGVEFPTNFRDIGYISFKKDQLGTKAMDVLKELIGFEILKVTT